ncbi:MAG: hypothetical protein ACTHMG_01030 [Sphingomonas sp.]
MAKDKKKKQKGAKLPKEIAGVTIPKPLRKQGSALLAQINTPLGRELIAAGLVAAGTALARRDEVRRAVADSAEGAEDAAAAGARVATQIGGIVGAAASAAFDQLLGASGRAKSDGGTKEA